MNDVCIAPYQLQQQKQQPPQQQYYHRPVSLPNTPVHSFATTSSYPRSTPHTVHHPASLIPAAPSPFNTYGHVSFMTALEHQMATHRAKMQVQ